MIVKGIDLSCPNSVLVGLMTNKAFFVLKMGEFY